MNCSFNCCLRRVDQEMIIFKCGYLGSPVSINVAYGEILLDTAVLEQFKRFNVAFLQNIDRGQKVTKKCHVLFEWPQNTLLYNALFSNVSIPYDLYFWQLYFHWKNCVGNYFDLSSHWSAHVASELIKPFFLSFITFLSIVTNFLSNHFATS